MFQKQLRYVQFILSFSIFAGLILSSNPLLLSSLVGLILVWQLEILTGQLRIDTNEYYLILIFIFITFFPVISSVLFLQFPVSLLFISLTFLSFLILIYQNINISKFGHTIFVTVFSSSIVSFIMSDSFQENISYLV